MSSGEYEPDPVSNANGDLNPCAMDASADWLANSMDVQERMSMPAMPTRFHPRESVSGVSS